MAKQIINIGTSANDGTGDKIRNAFAKVNSNFTELYDGAGVATLNEVLTEGNTTGGEDISISNGDKILLDNGANLKKGTTDAGLGGLKGIALRCAVDYELKWEAGRLYVMGGDGFTIREVSHNFTTTPTVTDDETKGFVVDSRWILDNGDLYICTDATTGASVWVLQVVGVTPTLQEVLDNNHDLVYGNNFQGTGAGNGNTGNAVNALGEYAARDNTGENINAFGQSAANDNSGNNLNAFGNLAANGNTGAWVNAFGDNSGVNNTFNNVNLLGQGSQADENGQTVLSKDNTIMARISTTDLTATRKYNLPDATGTIALTSDIPASTPDATTSIKGKLKLAGDLNGTADLPTIATNAVTNAKLAQVATKTFKGRTSSGTGSVEDMSVSTVRTDLSINNVDNTSDINKPVSTATQLAIDTATLLGDNANGQLSLVGGEINNYYDASAGGTGDGNMTEFYVKPNSVDFLKIINQEFALGSLLNLQSLILNSGEFSVVISDNIPQSGGMTLTKTTSIIFTNYFPLAGGGVFSSDNLGNIYIGKAGASPIINLSGIVNINKDKLLIKGTSTGKTNLTTSNTSATDYTVTLPATTGTVALTSQLATTMTNVAGGLVPTPPNNTTTFLRGDGTFAAPAGGGSNQVKLSSQTLTAGSWTLVGSYYEYTFSNANIVSTGFVNFTPNNASINEVSTCRMLPQIDAATGTCKFYSLFPPQTNIVGEIVIFIL